MSTVGVGVVGLCAMFVMMLLGLPVALAMMLVGALGVAYVLTPDAAVHLLSSSVWDQFSSYSLTVIPLFVLMGQIAYRSGVTDRLYSAAYSWFGRMPGGIASTTILTSMGFSCLSGSNAATAATMGTVAMPAMRGYRYSPALSTGSIAVGGTLGTIIPPSVVLIVIAIQTEQSIVRLFLGSLLPGVLLTALFVLSIVLVCWLKPALGPSGPATSLKQKLVHLGGVAETFVLFAAVIGGLVMGVFTPTEAGAIGVAGALVLALVRRSLSWRDAVTCVGETLRVSAMVILLLTGAVLFGRFLAVTRIPFELSQWAASLPLSAFAILAVIVLIYVIGGMLMDALGFLVVTLPIFFPLAMSLGVDPIWFTVLITLVTSLGAITPPVGINVFIVKLNAPEVPVGEIFKGVSLFFVSYLLCLAAISVFPELVLYLPRLL